MQMCIFRECLCSIRIFKEVCNRMSKVQSKNRVQQDQQTAPIEPAGAIADNKLFLIATIVIVFVVSLIRLRLLSIPLERDEGEYAYMGKLILNGIMPYEEAYSMKLPGTSFMYALMMGLFGKSITGIHLGLLLINSLTAFLLFFSFRKLFNSLVAFVAAAGYALFSVSPNMLGFAAHATQFVTFFVGLGLWFYSRYADEQKWKYAVFTGLALGMSFLMKQQAAFFLVFGGLLFLMTATTKKVKVISVFLYSVTALIPYLVTVALAVGAGCWSKFIFWTYTYASQYAKGATLERGIELFGFSFLPMFKEYWLLWLLFLLGMVIVFISSLSEMQKTFAVLLTVAGFCSVCPGFYFRPHYFISFLPAVALLAGIATDFIAQKIGKNKKVLWVPFTIVAASFLFAIGNNSGYYLQDDPETISQNIYGPNPFVSSLEIADYIKEHSTPADKIAILGSEPQIYFYADRKSATGYLYTYGLMEMQRYNKQMQAEMVKEIEQSKPEYLVFCKVGLSWLMQPDSPQDIFTWFYSYIEGRYELVGGGDVQEDAPIHFIWGAPAKNFRPQSDEFILVFKKSNSSASASN